MTKVIVPYFQNHTTQSKNVLLQTTTKMILPLFKRVRDCGVILGFLPCGLSSMAIRHLSIINSMNDIFFLHCKIISHQGIWSQIKKIYTSLALQDNFLFMNPSCSTRSFSIMEPSLPCKIIFHQVVQF
jgi:hypothetical protein